MLTCQQILDFCLDYLDGSLPEGERRDFQSHLHQCGECDSFFQTYRQTPAVSREALAVEMPQRVKEAIRSFLRTRCRPGSDCDGR